ncbi:copper chaperone PCu(A)C [Streptomyces sp. NPDC002073]|uniref:copper chaperone PCu(A)C n=1 Tax=Streptomyces sp. NBC_00239 TaxID=2903640 RepID=UPI002E2B2264|nr:copper chaperone PCu(A)C [Streptomyces sp. NBC_00239]
MNRRTTTLIAAALSLTAALAISGCSSDADKDAKPDLSVSGAFMPEPLNTDMAGGFLVVKNDSGTADKLTSVTSPLSDDVQVHETKNQKMQHVKSLDVPANGELKLARGGSHIMFMGLKNKPKLGDKVAIELHFEKAGPVKVELDVKDRTHNPKNH